MKVAFQSRMRQGWLENKAEAFATDEHGITRKEK